MDYTKLFETSKRILKNIGSEWKNLECFPEKRRMYSFGGRHHDDR